MQNEPSDIVALLVALLAFVTSREVAYLLGPYAAIVVSASAGAALSLSSTQSPLARWWQPITFIFVRVGVAIVLTVSIADVLVVGTDLKPRLMLIPVAFAIGAIRDYGAVLRWAGAAIRKVIPGWLANLGRRDG